MTRVEDSIFIDKEPEVVFDFVADERNELTYNPRMTSVELIAGDGPGVGARYRATMTSRLRPVNMSDRVHRVRASHPAQFRHHHRWHGDRRHAAAPP
jgi:Polyketide cyclase / dehydrase and lipid transport